MLVPKATRFKMYLFSSSPRYRRPGDQRTEGLERECNAHRRTNGEMLQWSIALFSQTSSLAYFFISLFQFLASKLLFFVLFCFSLVSFFFFFFRGPLIQRCLCVSAI